MLSRTKSQNGKKELKIKVDILKYNIRSFFTLPPRRGKISQLIATIFVFHTPLIGQKQFMHDPQICTKLIKTNVSCFLLCQLHLELVGFCKHSGSIVWGGEQGKGSIRTNHNKSRPTGTSKLVDGSDMSLCLNVYHKSPRDGGRFNLIGCATSLWLNVRIIAITSDSTYPGFLRIHL